MTAPAAQAQAAGRFELLRAVAAVADSPAGAQAVCPALGLTVPSATDHTTVFVLNSPPHASVYLGPDGALGGEGADRAAGFWRALGLAPPAEPDHLAALLGLYAELNEAAAQARTPATATALARSAHALFDEHLWPWLPMYLDSVADLRSALTGWARLVRQVVTAERDRVPASRRLPLSLRGAPPPGDDSLGPAGLAALLTIPARSGFILTRARLAAGAASAGVGHRIGERRFALCAMLGQDPAATLTWLASEAARCARQHARRGDPVSQWWARRATATTTLTRQLAESAAIPAPTRPGQPQAAPPTRR